MIEILNLERYKNMSPVRDEDESTLDSFASIGLVCYFFDWDNMEICARLTLSGLRHLNLELGSESRGIEVDK